VRYKVSHTYKTTGKILLLCTLIFAFLDSNQEGKRFCTERYQAFPDFNRLLIPSWMEFRLVRVVPKYLNFFTLSKDLLSIFMLWFCPAFWFRDMTMYLVFSAVTSRPISLLTITNYSAFFCILRMLPPNILTLSV
jgi:hypothetical protein